MTRLHVAVEESWSALIAGSSFQFSICHLSVDHYAWARMWELRVGALGCGVVVTLRYAIKPSRKRKLKG